MSRGSSTGHRILCVEDEAELREDMASELLEAGYEVVQAQDGVEAIAELQRQRFELVISDMRLPNISGIELLEHFRSIIDPESQIPFIFTTAFSDTQTQASALAAGAEQVLVKPIDYIALLKVIQDLMSRQ